MKHHQETEIKLEVRDLGAIRRRLAALEFRPIEARHFESNVLFDFKDLRLRKARCLLRLRFAGGKSVLTFKGAPRSEEHTSELQSRLHLVCRLLLEKKK